MRLVRLNRPDCGSWNGRAAFLLALIVTVGDAKADMVTYTTNAQATIYDGSFQGAPPFGPRDGIPDYFDFNRTPTGVLNAFLGSPGPVNVELRAAIEFDIRPLSGIGLNFATLRLHGSISEGGNFPSPNRLSGFDGDGVLTIQDWTRLDTFITDIPKTTSGQFYDVDVTSFIQNLIDGGDSFAGFALWQADVVRSSGFTFASGASLLLGADVGLFVPPPLGSPDPHFGEQPEPPVIPAPGAALLGVIGLTCVRVVRRRLA